MSIFGLLCMQSYFDFSQTRTFISYTSSGIRSAYKSEFKVTGNTLRRGKYAPFMFTSLFSMVYSERKDFVPLGMVVLEWFHVFSPTFDKLLAKCGLILVCVNSYFIFSNNICKMLTNK